MIDNGTAIPAPRSAGWPAFTAEHRADLVRYAASRLGRTRPAGQDAEDVVQDVLVRMLAQGGGRAGAADQHGERLNRPDAYLRRAVANACVSIWRRHRRETPAAEPPDRPVGDHADRCSTGLAVRGALAGLTERQREILTRGYFLNHSDRDIAAALGISPVTVRTLRRRGLARLRGLLSDGGHPERHRPRCQHGLGGLCCVGGPDGAGGPGGPEGATGGFCGGAGRIGERRGSSARATPDR